MLLSSFRLSLQSQSEKQYKDYVSTELSIGDDSSGKDNIGYGEIDLHNSVISICKAPDGRIWLFLLHVILHLVGTPDEFHDAQRFLYVHVAAGFEVAV